MVETFIGTYVKYRKSCRSIMKLEFSRQDFEKTRLWTLMKILPLGVELCVRDGWTDGRTDGQIAGHDEANNRFS